MSEDEMEKFEITDYDLDNEFNMHRNRKGLSKQQQIYGIWADNSDSDDESTPFTKQSKKPKNYSAPIGFVAGEVQQAGKKKEKELEPISFKTKNSSDESEEEKLRTGFGGPRPKAESTVTEITGDIAGMRTKKGNNSSFVNQGVGNWEKHTKGIGAKLLLQMGFQPGKGLGKDLQGISAPVEAHLRKGRGAIGAYGPEKPARIAKKPNEKKIKEDDDEETTIESKWQKNDNVKKKTRYYYRSVNDVIEKGKRPGAYRNSQTPSELSKVKVIDMTGPQQRVLSGYHALSGLKPPPGIENFEDVVHKKCSNFALPEIQHNLDLLVDMCEQDIIRIDRNTRYNKDKLVALKQEETSLKILLKNDEKVIDNLKHVMEVVDKLMDPSQGFSMKQIIMIFRDLQEEYYEEYHRYELGELAPGLIGPLLTSAMANWNPLTHSQQFLEVFDQWQELLEGPKQQKGCFEPNVTGVKPYDSLIWHTWMPVVRSAISNWNPRDCDSLISFLEAWKNVISEWVMENIMDKLVMPKILSEVNSWNPLTDTIPIHTWIHPWIPLLDSKLQLSVYPTIQEKLGVALSNWHPSDKSAKFILKPWQRALSNGAFVGFLIKHIVPKLQLCMQSLVINPHQQHLDPWHWVMDWQDMLSIVNMTLILDKFFFPRWLQTLAVWLNHNPNYTQVTEWYSGWKRMLSEELLAQPSIKDHFHKALEIMNRAVKIAGQPGAKESISYLTNMENNSIPIQPQPRVESFAEAVRTVSKIPQGFKDLVTKRCEEKGILFVPIPNKYHEAKQVYRIGTNGVQCYIDRNVIFYSQNNSTWIPTSLNTLLDIS
ncbi:unnamed protein product [Brassicogethes aeneus]|uniref:G-patch domain-containing protein n=1 Tax=Brassicogethes aeneus TaxID=1431903 RepID=A0A9P0FMX1_BRAAE|nr:unnamed protein product [Brassicogethes aeneus]